MRTIRKRNCPTELTEWRTLRFHENDPIRYPFTYNEMRRDRVVRISVESGLFNEQGGICAYTGRRIAWDARANRADFHVEHLMAQTRCRQHEDTDYENMVACWPAPNQRQATEYGAVRKDDWPNPQQAHLFVSPLLADCTSRFSYVIRGETANPEIDSEHTVWADPSSETDTAAKDTITNLNLNHRELRALRLNAVYGALNPSGEEFLSLEELQGLADEMGHAEQDLDAGATVTLDPFCFAVRQAIARRIQALQNGPAA